MENSPTIWELHEAKDNKSDRQLLETSWQVSERRVLSVRGTVNESQRL